MENKPKSLQMDLLHQTKHAKEKKWELRMYVNGKQNQLWHTSTLLTSRGGPIKWLITRLPPSVRVLNYEFYIEY